MEYGVQVGNKFAFMSDDEAEDPSDLIRKAEQDRVVKTAAQKKAEKEQAKKAKIQAELDRKTAADAAGKENRPNSTRGRGGRGRGAGPRPPRAEGEGGEFRPRPPRAEGEGGEFRPRPPRAQGEAGEFRGRGRGGPRPPFRGRGGNVNVPADGGHTEVAGEEQPAFDGERPARRGGRDGFSGSRGAFAGGRGGRGRPFDRQSGSDRTGFKPQEKKDGHGKGNWGTDQDQVAAESEEVKVASGDEAEVVPPAPREKTAEELELEAIEAEIAKQKTLAEYRATLQKEETKFNVRKAGEGAEENFGKLVPIARKEQVEEGDQYEEIVITRPDKKKTLNIDFRFTEPNRGERTDRRGGSGAPRGRGGSGAPRGRGGRGAARGGARTQSTAFNAADSEAFPALGAH